MMKLHLPVAMLSVGLNEAEKRHYDRLRGLAKAYLSACTNKLESIVQILDAVESSKQLGSTSSERALQSFLEYLRIKILSDDLATVEDTVVLIDALVKNSGYRIHNIVGKKMYMKTLSSVARRHLLAQKLSSSRLSDFIFDCLQAWGEAFEQRKHMYPHICDTYFKLKHKYGVHFLRPERDPTRVPIFLGPSCWADEKRKKLVADEDYDDTIVDVDVDCGSSESDLVDISSSTAFLSQSGQVDVSSHCSGFASILTSSIDSSLPAYPPPPLPKEPGGQCFQLIDLEFPNFTLGSHLYDSTISHNALQQQSSPKMPITNAVVQPQVWRDQQGETTTASMKKQDPFASLDVSICHLKQDLLIPHLSSQKKDVRISHPRSCDEITYSHNNTASHHSLGKQSHFTYLELDADRCHIESVTGEEILEARSDTERFTALSEAANFGMLSVPSPRNVDGLKATGAVIHVKRDKSNFLTDGSHASDRIEFEPMEVLVATVRTFPTVADGDELQRQNDRDPVRGQAALSGRVVRQRPAPSAPPFTNPSSDPNLQARFYGTQRIVVKKSV